MTQNWIDKTIKLAPTPPSTASPLPPPTPSIEKLEDKENVVMAKPIKYEKKELSYKSYNPAGLQIPSIANPC